MTADKGSIRIAKSKAPTKADYENLFNAMLNQTWVLHPRVSHGAAWFNLYRLVLMTGRKRPHLSDGQERYLAAMGFDERVPIANPEASRWHKDLKATGLAEDPIHFRPRRPLLKNDYFGHDAWVDLEEARRFILVDRMLRGVALRETGQECVPFEAFVASRTGSSACAVMSFEQAQSDLLGRIEDDEPVKFDPWHRVVIDREAKKIVVIENAITKVYPSWRGIAATLRNLVSDLASPEHGYDFVVVQLTEPTPSDDPLEKVYNAACYMAGVPHLRIILTGAGVARNRSFSVALTDQVRMADYILALGTEWLEAVAPWEEDHRERLRHDRDAATRNVAKTWLYRVLAVRWQDRRTSDMWQHRVDAAVGKIVNFSPLLASMATEYAAKKGPPVWDQESAGSNDLDLLEEPLRSRERERYAAHKRERLTALVGDRITEPRKRAAI